MKEKRRACGQDSFKKGIFLLCVETVLAPHEEAEKTRQELQTAAGPVKENRGLAFHVLLPFPGETGGAGPLIIAWHRISPGCMHTFPRCHRWKVDMTNVVALICGIALYSA